MSCVNIANGINKVVSYKKEDVCWGELPSLATGAKQIRRVSSNFNLSKETYTSEEIRTDYQMVDFRHGVRSVEGSISGELSPATYSDFIGSALGRDFTAVSAVGPIDIDLDVVGAPIYVIERTTGDFLTSGIKLGMVIRLSGIGLNAANVGVNLLVIGVTALTLSVISLNGKALVAEVATSASLEVQGKVSYVPSANHTDDSYTFEEYYADIQQSEVYTGNKVGSVSLALPATGLVTAEISFMGKDLEQTGTSQYFTSPTPSGENGIFASVNGALIVAGQPVALITSLNVNINRNLTMEPVVGSNVHPDIEVGRVLVDGDFSTLFADGYFRELFKNEEEVSLVAALSTNNADDADFVAITLPRIKVNSDTKDDGEKSIVSQNSFQALKGFGTSGAEATTIQIQDSALV